MENLNLHKVPPSDSSSSQAIRGQHETGPNLWNEEHFEQEQFLLKLANENKAIRKLAELLPGCYNENNGIFSAECEHCMNHFHKHSWTGADNVQGDTTNSSICYGGDLMWLSYILGLTGPNGKHFCNDCLVSLQDTPKSVPHSPVILPKYQNNALTEGKDFPLHSIQSITDNAERFQQNGVKNLSNYLNCEHPPLIDLSGSVTQYTSVTPLHISLGLGLKNVNVAEEEAVKEDAKIRAEDGITLDNVANVIETRDNCCKELQNLEIEHDELVSCLSATENGLEMLKLNSQFAFEKDCKRFKDKSKDAVLIRKRSSELGKDIEKFNNSIKHNLAHQKTKKSELASTLESINKDKGPFKTQFDKVLDSFKELCIILELWLGMM